MADAAAGAGGAAADAPGGGADADVDALADDLEAELVSRDEEGKFLGQTRRRRRPKAPNFSIIEAIGVESTAGPSTSDGDGGSTPQSPTWLIRGPVRGWSNDGWRMSMLTTVRALSAMPRHEVYVRSAAHLVPGTYADEDDFLASVKHVAKAATRAGETWDTAGANSSYRGLAEGQELDDADVRLILRQAAGLVRRAAKRVADGYVALVKRRPAHNDLAHCAALQALLRQRSIAAVADYRRKGATAMRLRWRLLLRAIGAGKVALMRRMLELNHGDTARGTDRRASRVRLSWGSSQMRLLPTAAQLREERRRGFDDEDRIPHFFFRDGDGGSLSGGPTSRGPVPMASAGTAVLTGARSGFAATPTSTGSKRMRPAGMTPMTCRPTRTTGSTTTTTMWRRRGAMHPRRRTQRGSSS